MQQSFNKIHWQGTHDYFMRIRSDKIVRETLPLSHEDQEEPSCVPNSFSKGSLGPSGSMVHALKFQYSWERLPYSSHDAHL